MQPQGCLSRRQTCLLLVSCILLLQGCLAGPALRSSTPPPSNPPTLLGTYGCCFEQRTNGDGEISNRNFRNVKNMGECPAAQRQRRATIFIAGMTCERYQHNALTFTPAPPTPTHTTHTPTLLGAGGCCYDESMGSKGVVSYSNYRNVKTDKDCPTAQRMGGATKFAHGMTCERFQAEQSASQVSGCCYEESVGAMGVKSYSAFTHTTAGECNTHQRMGGATRFIAAPCEELQAILSVTDTLLPPPPAPPATTDAPLPPATHTPTPTAPPTTTPKNLLPTLLGAGGCCYDENMGAMGVKSTDNFRNVKNAADCPTAQRMGGATKFVPGMTCERFQAGGAIPATHPSLPPTTPPLLGAYGCCYDVSFGAGMKPFFGNYRDEKSINSCRQEKRMGGETRWSAAMTCAQFQATVSNGNGNSRLLTDTDTMSLLGSNGCCYDIGFGAGMQPIYSNYRNARTETECPAEQRMGGATVFVHGMTCERFQAEQNVKGAGGGRMLQDGTPAPPSLGCCFDVSLGTMGIPFYSNFRLSNNAACHVEQRMGGATIYAKDKHCDTVMASLDIEIATPAPPLTPAPPTAPPTPSVSTFGAPAAPQPSTLPGPAPPTTPPTAPTPGDASKQSTDTNTVSPTGTVPAAGTRGSTGSTTTTTTTSTTFTPLGYPRGGCCYTIVKPSPVGAGVVGVPVYGGFTLTTEDKCPVTDGVSRFAVTTSCQPIIEYAQNKKYTVTVPVGNGIGRLLQTKVADQPTGCCYEEASGALGLKFYSKFRDVTFADCNTEQRMGGATRYMNEKCAVAKQILEQDPNTMRNATHVIGCCFKKSIGSNGKKTFTDFNTTMSTECHVEQRAGGATLFSEKDCNTLQGELSAPFVDDVYFSPPATVETAGCCYQDTIGANNTHTYSNFYPATRTGCPTEQRLGGGTKYSDTPCKKLQSELNPSTTPAHRVSEIEESDSPSLPPTHTPHLVGASGCCYDEGTGAMGVTFYGNYKNVNAVSECATEQRMGGATRFAAGMTCERFQAQQSSNGNGNGNGCCYELHFVARMKRVFDKFTDMESVDQCATQERIGGARRWAAGVTCAQYKQQQTGSTTGVDGGRRMQSNGLLGTSGCCYDIGFGAGMQPIYSNYRNARTESECPAEQRMGGATVFVHGMTCERFQAEQSANGSARRVQETGISETAFVETGEHLGCCYEEGTGAMGVKSYSNFRPSVQDDCTVEQRMGGATRYNEKSCTDLQAALNTGNSRLLQAAGLLGSSGCCYDESIGSMGVKTYTNYRNTVSEEDCPVAQRMGGATLFVHGYTCERYQAEQSAVSGDGNNDGNSRLLQTGGLVGTYGCCYDESMGSMGVYTYSNYKNVQHIAECPIAQRMGGATKFAAGTFCEQLQAQQSGGARRVSSEVSEESDDDNNDSDNDNDDTTTPPPTTTPTPPPTPAPVPGCCYSVGDDATFTHAVYGNFQDTVQHMCEEALGYIHFSPNTPCSQVKMLALASGGLLEGMMRANGIDIPPGTVMQVLPTLLNLLPNDKHSPLGAGGCCFEQSIGAMGVKSYSNFTNVKNAHECPVSQRMGGATMFVHGYTCERYQAELSAPPTPRTTPLLGAGGCCYDESMGAMGVKSYTNYRNVKSETECPAEQRMGGATVFVSGYTCERYQAEQSSNGNGNGNGNGNSCLLTGAYGCCVDQSIGAMGEKSYSNYRNARSISDCPVEQRMGGATLFIHGMFCERYQAEQSKGNSRLLQSDGLLATYGCCYTEHIQTYNDGLEIVRSYSEYKDETSIKTCAVDTPTAGEGIVRWSAGETCEQLKARQSQETASTPDRNVRLLANSRLLQTDGLLGTFGCCYSEDIRSFDDYTSIQRVYGNFRDENSVANCTQGSRAADGGVFKWAAGMTCEMLKADQSSETAPTPDRNVRLLQTNGLLGTYGCCYDVGFGAYMVPIYANYRDENTDKKCPVGERIGGATRWAAGVTCVQLQASQAQAAEGGRRLQEGFRSIITTLTGCCYDTSIGANNQVSYSNFRATTAEFCPVEQRLGGATRFEPKQSCQMVQALISALPGGNSRLLQADGLLGTYGCCYAEKIQTYDDATVIQRSYSDFRDETSVDRCPVDAATAGDGITRWAAGVTCVQLKAVQSSGNSRLLQSDQTLLGTSGCCVDQQFGAMGVRYTLNYRNAKSETECPVAQRMGGSTVFVHGLTCERLQQQNTPATEASELAATPTHTPTLLGAGGCCYEVSMEDMGVKSYSNYRNANSETECPSAQRLGGATVFVQGYTCERYQAEQSTGNSRLLQADGLLGTSGCCYDASIGSHGVYAYSNYRNAVSVSECPVEQRLGGATVFVPGYTCERFQAEQSTNNFDGNSRLLQADGLLGTYGCCYTEGVQWYDDYMYSLPIYKDYHDETSADKCPVAVNAADGTEIKWAAGVTCVQLQATQSAGNSRLLQAGGLLGTSGCCYDESTGAMGVKTYSNYRNTQSETACPVEQRMGGATKFVPGMTCERFQAEQSTDTAVTPPTETAEIETVATGCCYEETSPLRGMPRRYFAFRSTTENDCKPQQRHGGATRFAVGQDCDALKSVLKANGIVRRLQADGLLGTYGCCYAEKIQTYDDATVIQRSYSDFRDEISVKTCPVDTPTPGGGITRWSAGTTCVQLQAEQSKSNPRLLQADGLLGTSGCCVDQQFGSMGVRYTLNYRNAQTEAECPVAQRMGGSTVFVHGLTCERLQMQQGGASDLSISEGSTTGAAAESTPTLLGAGGCCYEVNTGAMGVKTYTNYRNAKSETECPIAQRMGGATVFVHGMTCERFQAEQSTTGDAGGDRRLQEDELDTGADESFPPVSGCCFDVGYGAYMVPVYSNYRDVESAQVCPIATRNGGATVFQAGTTCADFQAVISGTTTDKVPVNNGNGSIGSTGNAGEAPVLPRRLIRN